MARAICVAVILLLVITCGAAHAGTAFGVHAGYSDVNGDAFTGSGRIGGTPLFGLQAIFPVAPTVSFEVMGESCNETLTFDQAGFEGALLQGKGKWNDLSLHASLRLRVIPLGIGPAGLYVGAGAGVHFSKVDLNGGTIAITPALARNPVAPAGDPVGDFIHQAQKEQTNVSYHALAGLSVGIPILPLSVFGEARYEDMRGNFPRQSYLVYAGANLELP
jgi:hypothetical protein